MTRYLNLRRRRPSSQAGHKKGSKTRRLCIEPLEQRTLLSISVVHDLSVREMSVSIGQHAVTGATIITHGFQLGNSETWGDSLMPLALAIRNRADAATPLENDAWLLDYDVGFEGGEGHFDAVQSILPPRDDRPGHVVLLFDWAPESQEGSAGWAEAAGDALFSLLVGLGVVQPELGALNATALHFIGHSFGAAVTSEAVERLAAFNVPVDQVTYLDPHDFGQRWLPFDESQELFSIGVPQLAAADSEDRNHNYGVTVWSNVAFADVYYQTRGRGTVDTLVPEGRPIPGAFNVLLRGGNQLPESYPFSFENDHTWVWNGYYLATVTGTLTGAPRPEGSVDWGSTGYAFSRVAGGEELREQARGNFFLVGQDHEHSSPVWFTDRETKTAPNCSTLAALGLTDADPVTQLNEHRWAPVWDRLQIANGDFQHDRSGSLVPGWSDHGGGGRGRVTDEGGGRYVLELGDSHPSRTHNRLYVPLEAAGLQFDLQCVKQTAKGNRLEVLLGNTVLGTYDLSGVDTAWRRKETVVIPGELREQAKTLAFRIVADDQHGGQVDAEVHIDNVQFVRGLQTGDVFFLDLRGHYPEATRFAMEGQAELIDPRTGNSVTVRAVQYSQRTPARTDWRLVTPDGKVAGYVLFSDRFDSDRRPFGNTGQLYFVPGTEDGIAGDSSVSRGFQSVFEKALTARESRGI